MRRRVPVIVALVALVVGLVAVNLSMREDPEPEFEPPPRIAPPADSINIEVDQIARPASERLGTSANPVPSVAQAAAEEEDTEGVVVDASCEHGYVPSLPGERRDYRWSQAGEERTADLSLRALRVREREGGERAVTWSISVIASDDESSLGQARLTTRCTPGESAEEPWFGILERSLGLRIFDAPGRWRWPPELRAGTRFDGTVAFDPSDSDMEPAEGEPEGQILRVTREHIVETEESVTVPAGTFRAWRVDYEERHSFGARGETGTGSLWVARDVGLVRSTATNSAGVTQTIELMSLTSPE